ncbi:MAG: peptidase [Proteobacteria bacterium]|nr:peptidase [Pseudomonadota bacterium]NOG58906.1 peptidase [Pseudomonadota bacterium]
MNFLKKMFLVTSCLVFSLNVNADDNYDLDDIRDWDIVSVETCLDAVLDTIAGNPRKLEMKMEGDDPVYEFDIDAKDGNTYNVECNAEEGFVTEIEREVSSDDPVFKKLAKISKKEAEATALEIHPGEVVSSELEVGFDGSVTYEFDIQTKLGYEIKVDVDAVTGEIEEANIELYEIGSEKE